MLYPMPLEKKICVVCGKEFMATHREVTCSPTCSNEHHRNLVRKNNDKQKARRKLEKEKAKALKVEMEKTKKKPERNPSDPYNQMVLKTKTQKKKQQKDFIQTIVDARSLGLSYGKLVAVRSGYITLEEAKG